MWLKFHALPHLSGRPSLHTTSHMISSDFSFVRKVFPDFCFISALYPGQARPKSVGNIPLQLLNSLWDLLVGLLCRNFKSGLHINSCVLVFLRRITWITEINNCYKDKQIITHTLQKSGRRKMLKEKLGFLKDCNVKSVVSCINDVGFWHFLCFVIEKSK